MLGFSSEAHKLLYLLWLWRVWLGVLWFWPNVTVVTYFYGARSNHSSLKLLIVQKPRPLINNYFCKQFKCFATSVWTPQAKTPRNNWTAMNYFPYCSHMTCSWQSRSLIISINWILSSMSMHFPIWTETSYFAAAIIMWSFDLPWDLWVRSWEKPSIANNFVNVISHSCGILFFNHLELQRDNHPEILLHLFHKRAVTKGLLIRLSHWHWYLVS